MFLFISQKSFDGTYLINLKISTFIINVEETHVSHKQDDDILPVIESLQHKSDSKDFSLFWTMYFIASNFVVLVEYLLFNIDNFNHLFLH